MVYQDVMARIVGFELNHGGAARSNRCGLHIGQRRTGQGGLAIYLVEDFTDDVETGCQVGTANTEEDAHGFAHFGLDRKSVVSGKSVSVRVDLGGRRLIKKKKTVQTAQLVYTIYTYICTLNYTTPNNNIRK